MSDDWDRLQALFREIVRLPLDARALRMALISESDPELHAEILSLLDADEQANELLKQIEAAGSIVSPPVEAGEEEDDRGEPDLLPRLENALRERYRIERQVGRGGMAIVYLAHDLKHDRQVALKLLRPEVAASVGIERFLREIKIAAGLNHPNILPLHDSGEADGLLFFVMPFVDGESLRERLGRETTLSVGEALQIAGEIAEALGYAHALGVVHRDIKPGNILLSGGHAVIADFGIALAVSAADAARFTETGLSLGTPAYMSPEQVEFSDEVDGRSDIYSLGCVLYEMLAGEPPFGATSAPRILKAHLATPPPDLRRIRPDVTPPLVSVVDRALAKAPSDRFPTAEAFGDALAASQTSESQLESRETGDVMRWGRRGSLWQVLASYAFGSWIVLQVAEALASLLGLPLWFGKATVFVLALGLPVLVLTAVAQSKRRSEGKAPDDRRRLRRFLTWRGALAGGVGAFALLGLGTAGYVSRDRIRGVLRRMERDPAERTDLEVAREVAVREGMAAVIAGEVIRAGESYLLTAELVEAASGEVLATVRATAESSGAVLAAIDRLSKELRERIGEPLKSLRNASMLPAVTTSSLEALEKYVAGVDMPERARGIALLEEAVALDSGFAMAWRRLGVFLGAQDAEYTKRLQAYTRAFDHRDRLSRDERYLVEGSYYFETGEYEKAIVAYENLLALPSDDREELGLGRSDFFARHNMALSYRRLRRYEQAYEILLALLRDHLPFHCGSNYAMLYDTEVDLGKLEEARKNSEDCPYLYEAQAFQQREAALIAGAVGDYAAAEMRYQIVRDVRGEELRWRAEASQGLANVASVQGKLAEADEHARDAMVAHEARELPGDFLRVSVETAERDMLVRGDTLRALRGLELALQEAPYIDLDPLDGPYLQLAALYAQAGQPRVARTLLAQFDEAVEPRYRVDVRSSNVLGGEEYRRARGELALAEGRHEDAVEEFRAADVEACLVCALPGLARAYEAAGEEDSVVAVLERYVATPNYYRLRVDRVHLGPTLERLGQLYEARGQVEEAAMCYARFVELWADADSELQGRVEAAQQRLEISGSPAGGCGFAPPPAGGSFESLAVTDSAGCHTVRGSINETNNLGTIEGDLEGETLSLGGRASQVGAEFHMPQVHTWSITGGTVPELVGRDVKLWGDHVSLDDPAPGSVIDFDSNLRVRYPGSGDLTLHGSLDGTDFPPTFTVSFEYDGVVCP